MLNNTQKIEHRPAVEWTRKNKTKQQNYLQWRAGSLKHSVNLWQTFFQNNIERQQMYGSVGKYEKTKKELEKKRVPLLGPWCRWCCQGNTIITLYVHLLSICGFSLHLCMLSVCMCMYIYVNVLYIYLHLGLRITCPNRSQGKTFIQRTFTKMI